jgi:hypothetical protein
VTPAGCAKFEGTVAQQAGPDAADVGAILDSASNSAVRQDFTGVIKIVLGLTYLLPRRARPGEA